MGSEEKTLGDALLQLCNLPLEIILGKIARVFFKSSLRGLGQQRIKQHESRHILPERLCDAGELLGQHPNADAGVASGKAELEQLPGPPFHVFRGCPVIKDDESIDAFKTQKVNLVLLADDLIQPRVSFGEAV